MPKESMLKVIADNQLLFNELRKIFDAEFSDSVSPIELGFSNERLGERVRARMEGKMSVERAFNKIMEYQTPPTKMEKENPAR